jgi:hypothetical protein
MSDRIIEGSTKFLCATIELAMGRIDLCKCSECGGPRDNGWACDECGEGYCDPITEDCHTEVAIRAINSHDKLTAQVAELRAVVYEANKYLDINNLTTIGHGSKLHEWFKQALELSE